MKVHESTFSLCDGRVCTLRSPERTDALQLIHHLYAACGETPFLLREPDELHFTEEQEADFLQALLSAPRAVMVSAWVDDNCIANADIQPVGHAQRAQHRANFAISVQKAFGRQGIATKMMEMLIACARAFGYEQIELEVVDGNDHAIALYEKFGFRHYGTRPNALHYRDGSVRNEHLMYLML